MKMTEYPEGDLVLSDIFLIDGTEGTRKISAEAVWKVFLDSLPGECHNSIFRGKNLGSGLTPTQKSNLANGTFKDLWLGDYWEINGVKWRIAHFDYWYNSGATALAKHHAVVVPDTNLYTAKMNDSATNDNGYTGSSLYLTGLDQAKQMVTDAFGTYAIAHYDRYSKQFPVTSGAEWEWKNDVVNLMNEEMVFGSMKFGTMKYTVSRSQLALFAMCPKFIANNENYWLNNPSQRYGAGAITGFAGVGSTGIPDYYGDTGNTIGVRPAVAIGQ